MQVSEQFLKAKRDKNLRDLIVAKRDNRTFMYLCIDTPKKYTDDKVTQFIETDTTFNITNYSNVISGTGKYEGETNVICFHLNNISFNGISHVQTFLNAIKKDSDVSFRIVAYNGCEYYKESNLVSHQLYGIIDGNRYLLENFVGKDNSASPVRAY
jgi:hypothetical protein